MRAACGVWRAACSFCAGKLRVHNREMTTAEELQYRQFQAQSWQDEVKANQIAIGLLGYSVMY
jgi:hypothetical protein